MISILRFVRDSILCGRAYIDLDGCLLRRFRCPPGSYGVFALQWWTENLAPTPVIKRRLPLLYVLRLMGVQLVIWTNRQNNSHHIRVTEQALGRHMWLFSEMQFHGGLKGEGGVYGPVMDDQKKYLACGVGHGLLVEQL